jgi:peptide/nickel transport system substrate-binding protein
MNRRPHRRQAALRLWLLATLLLVGCGSAAPPTAITQTAAPPSGSATPSGTVASLLPSSTAAASGSPRPALTSRMSGLVLDTPQREGGVMNYGMYDPEIYSPIAGYWNEAIQVIYQSLVELHPRTLEPVPSLAESWQSNADFTTWTVKLREGVTWHDGKPFTAQDVKFTFDIHLNPAGPSADVARLTQVLKATVVVDPLTIRFELHGPSTDFVLRYMADYAIVPTHLLRDVPVDKLAEHPHFTGADAQAVIGTGPFRFQERGEGVIRTVRYDDYWEGRPILDAIVFHIVEDPAEGERELRAGTIDVFDDLDSSALRTFANSQIATYLEPEGSLRNIAFNLDPSKTPLFQDRRVRQALFHAINREAIGQVAEDGIPRVPSGILPPGSTLDNPEGVTVRYAYDPERAAALLEEAGWRLGSDGIRAKDGTRLAFSLYIPAGDSARKLMAAELEQYWRAVGVEVKVVAEHYQALNERIFKTRDFETVFRTYWTPMYAPNQLSLLGCRSSEAEFNIMRYCNTEVDSLFTQVEREVDLSKRVVLYTAIENQVMTDLPLIPLNYSTELVGYNTRLRNYGRSPSSIINAHLWWVKQ